MCEAPSSVLGASQEAEDLEDFEVPLEALLSRAPGFAQRVTCALCLSNASDAVETLSLSFALPLLHFEGLQMLTAAVFVGMLLGGAVAGGLAERLGHKRLLVHMLYLEAFAAVLTAGVWSAWQLAVCRFMSGFAIGAAVPPIFALAEELIHPKAKRRRSQLLASLAFIFFHLIGIGLKIYLGYLESP